MKNPNWYETTRDLQTSENQKVSNVWVANSFISKANSHHSTYTTTFGQNRLNCNKLMNESEIEEALRFQNGFIQKSSSFKVAEHAKQANV